NYADSLSAASTGKPLFLVKETLNNRQKEVLAALLDKGCTFTILGGEKAVTPEMEALIRAEVGNALAEERIAGSTRYHTSRMIAERYFPDAKSVVLAVGDNYPDGLCGGLLALTRKAPILLTIAGRESIAKVYAESRGIHAGLILGGPKLISNEMARDILGLDENVEVTERFYQ
ncbi:MAG: cell wall-binding repeat-containing protein, partial [Lachnospiraceae bacterium]|nr:cell wall-binding repeat-containing protein [Lachnospiraceae bacterium]